MLPPPRQYLILYYVVAAAQHTHLAPMWEKKTKQKKTKKH